MERPSEQLQAYIGAIVSAVLLVAAWIASQNGKTLEIPAPVVAAITFLLSLIAAGVTKIVSARQKDGLLTSGPDGKVLS